MAEIVRQEYISGRQNTSISNYPMEIDNSFFGEKDADKMTYNGSDGVEEVKNLPDVHMDKTKNQIRKQSPRQERVKIKHQLLRRKDALICLQYPLDTSHDRYL